MEKQLYITLGSTGYDFKVTPISFNDNGVNRVKFKVQDPFSTYILQRMEGDNWLLLEGDLRPDFIQPLGNVIRKNFDT
jgi:hypothetical protein